MKTKSYTFLVRLVAIDKNKKTKAMTIIEVALFEDETGLDFDIKVNEHLHYFLFHNHCEKGFYQICGVVRKDKYCYFYEG